MNCGIEKLNTDFLEQNAVLPYNTLVDFCIKRINTKEKRQSKIAEELLREFLIQKHGIKNVQITRTQYGKPEAVLDGKYVRNVSISHSKGYFSVAATEASFLGIDVQHRVTWDNPNKQQAAFTLRELKCLENTGVNIDSLDAYTVLWSAKEAVCKALGVGFLKGFHYAEILTDFKNTCELYILCNKIPQMLNPMLFYGVIDEFVCTFFVAT